MSTTNTLDPVSHEPIKPLEIMSGEVFAEDEIATLREMEHTSASLQRARERGAIKPPPDWDGESCSKCYGDIDHRRLKLGYHTCIECERAKEIREKQYAR